MNFRGIRKLIIAVVASVALVAPTAVSLGAAAPASAAPVGTFTQSVSVRTAVVPLVVSTTFETAIVTITNIKRAAVGCRALRVNTALRKAARRHSYTMGSVSKMSHQAPGELSLGPRLRAAGYVGWSRAAENVAAGFTSARTVVRAWWNSTGHRRNITNCALREIGVGVVYYGGRYWITQDFGRR